MWIIGNKNKYMILCNRNKKKLHYIYTYTQGYQQNVYKYKFYSLFTSILIITKKMWISNKFNILSTI